MALEESEGHPGPECRGSRGSRATDERGSIRVLPGFQHPCRPPTVWLFPATFFTRGGICEAG